MVRFRPCAACSAGHSSHAWPRAERSYGSTKRNKQTTTDTNAHDHNDNRIYSNRNNNNDDRRHASTKPRVLEQWGTSLHYHVMAYHHMDLDHRVRRKWIQVTGKSVQGFRDLVIRLILVFPVYGMLPMPAYAPATSNCVGG